MNIIWLMKLTLIALTVSTPLSFATNLAPSASGSDVKVQGLIVVMDSTPMVVYSK
jgi:hypothetical protein